MIRLAERKKCRYQGYMITGHPTRQPIYPVIESDMRQQIGKHRQSCMEQQMGQFV